MLRASMVLLACLGAGAGLHAEQVYRWVDENGRVHYGQLPQGKDAERVEIRSPQPVSNDARSEAERRAMRERLLQSYAAERREKQAAAAARAEQKRQRGLRCKQLDRAWKNLNHYGPIYYKNRVGDRVFLNEDERSAEKQRLAQQLQSQCGGVPEQ